MMEVEASTPTIFQMEELVKNTIHEIAEIEDKISTNYDKVEQMQVGTNWHA